MFLKKYTQRLVGRIQREHFARAKRNFILQSESLNEGFSLISRRKMDVINKLYSSVSNSVSQLSNVLPGNPLSREYEIEAQVCSAGIGKFERKNKP